MYAIRSYYGKSWSDRFVVLFHGLVDVVENVRNGADHPVPARHERRLHRVLQKGLAGPHDIFGKQLDRLLFLVRNNFV